MIGSAGSATSRVVPVGADVICAPLVNAGRWADGNHLMSDAKGGGSTMWKHQGLVHGLLALCMLGAGCGLGPDPEDRDPADQLRVSFVPPNRIIVASTGVSVQVSASPK